VSLTERRFSTCGLDSTEVANLIPATVLTWTPPRPYRTGASSPCHFPVRAQQLTMQQTTLLKVVLAVPEYRGRRTLGENLGISYVDASLRNAGVAQVTLLNRMGNMATKAMLDEIESQLPHVVGLSLPSHYLLKNLEDFVRAIKNRTGCIVVVGGHYMMFRGEHVMKLIPEIDMVALGEGEYTMIEIVRTVVGGGSFREVPGLIIRENSQLFRTVPRRSIEDLDALPFPSRDPGGEVYNLSGSRGCYTTCSFCSVPQFYRAQPGRSFRLRSVASISAEIRELREIGAKAISFVDDVFVLPGKKGLSRVQAIADVMNDNGLKWAFACRTPDLREDIVSYCANRGLCNVGLGIESGSVDVLNRLSKRATIENSRQAIRICRDHGIVVTPYFIMFEPDMSLHDVRLNVEFLKEFDLLWPSFAAKALDPYPGTPAFDRLECEGRLVEKDYQYLPLFSDKSVEKLMLQVKDPLREAEKLEFELHRLQFRADLAPPNERDIRSSVIQNFLRDLSDLTFWFFDQCLQGENVSNQYGENVEKLQRRIAVETK
jgi:radical SAM superfamily enzyme YgiQ (UPF0313 family)